MFHQVVHHHHNTGSKGQGYQSPRTGCVLEEEEKEGREGREVLTSVYTGYLQHNNITQKTTDKVTKERSWQLV